MKKVTCPTCGKPVEWSTKARFKPFCSERCKLIDLGDWASGEHRIAGEQTDISEQVKYPFDQDES